MAKRRRKRALSRISRKIRRKGTTGALRRQARKAGYQSVRGFCGSLQKGGKWKKGVSARTKRRCNLARTFRKYRKR